MLTPSITSSCSTLSANWRRPFDTKKYVRALGFYTRMIEEATSHTGAFKLIEPPDLSWKGQSTDLLIDVEIPFDALQLCLLFVPKDYKGNYWEPDTITQIHNDVFRERKDLLGGLEPKPTTVPYKLYWYSQLAAEISEGKLIIHDPDLYRRCLYPRSEAGGPYIDDELIDEVIRNGLIPESSRGYLLKLRGFTLRKALNDSKYQGNKKRAGSIEEEEIKAAGVEDRFRRITAEIIHNEGTHFKMEDFSPKGRAYITSPTEQMVYRYLRGDEVIESISLSNDNAEEILALVKIVEWAKCWSNCLSVVPFSFRENADMKLRAKIMQVLPTHESFKVFSRTLVDGKMQDARQWVKASHWTTEWAAKRALTAVARRIEADSLAKVGRITYATVTTPPCIAVRGNTAVGKSTLIRSLLTRNYPSSSVDNQDGVMNPDRFKAQLKRRLGTSCGELLNFQIHREGAALFDSVFNELKTAPAKPYVLDMRLLKPEDVLDELIKPAERKGLPVILHDVEGPSLTCSLLRVLLRPLYGKDPCPPSQPIIDGYTASIKYRSEIISLALARDSVIEYKLYFDGAVIAEKCAATGPHLEVYNRAVFDRCTELPYDIDRRIDEEVTKVITDEMIDEAARQGYIRESQKETLRTWTGIQLSEAVDLHSKGKSPVRPKVMTDK